MKMKDEGFFVGRATLLVLFLRRMW